MPERHGPRELAERLGRHLEEGEPAAVAAMQLLMQAETPDEARDALAIAERLPGSSGSRASGSLRRVADLIRRNPAAWRTVHDLTRSIEHRPIEADPLAHWARVFDELARLSPEASVALYSLGNAQLLAQATGEIVQLLEHWGLLERASVVLDIGCGIGRLEAALASRVASVTGIDLSREMLGEARRRCGELSNVRFALGSGSDLTGTADDSVDLLLMIDTFPYVMLSGPALAARHLAEAARVVASRGSVLILNAAYSGDADRDLAELVQLADGAGLEVHRADWRPLGSWDAPAFQLKHAARSRA